MIMAEEMSAVGLGTEYLAENSADDDEVGSRVEQIRRSVEGGVNTLDTSPVSGQGWSEVAIGDYIDEDNRREDLFLTSKCGYEWDLEEGLTRDLSLERLHQELEESMNRMQVDVLDLYLLNTVGDDGSFKESFNSLGQIKNDRNVRNIGLKQPTQDQLRNALEITNLDFVQLPYSLFDHEPFNRLESICTSNEIRIIVTDVLEGTDSEENTDSEKSTVSSNRTRESFKERLRFVLETYFDRTYPDESIDALMARWAIGSPGVHSGVLESTKELGIQTILRVLDIHLTSEDYRAIDRLLASMNR